MTPGDPLDPQATVPVSPQRVVHVDGGFVTRFVRGPLRVAGQELRWMSGAVHDADGVVVPESQRAWAGDEKAPVAADPEVLPVPQQARLLEGSWQYAGHWTRHFGHFLLETLSNLWPDPADRAEPLAGLVAHRSCYGPAPRTPGQGDATRRADLLTWQRALLDLAGYGDLPVEVVRAQPLRVERLAVPGRPLLLKAWAGPESVALWRRMAARVAPGGAERVFLSRSRFHAEHQDRSDKVRVEEDWEQELERRFAAAGFVVVHPETLPVPEQVALVRGARTIAGSAGSALHLAVFAGAGATVVEVGDLRTPTSPLPSQRIVDAACGHRSLFTPYGDLPRLEATLAGL